LTRISGQLTQLTSAALGRGFYAFVTNRNCQSLIQPCTDQLTIARFKVDGTPDTHFSGDGLAQLEGPLLGFTNVLVQPDGKFVVGVGALPQSHKPGLIRLTADGQLDRTFGSEGQLPTETVVKGTHRPVQPTSLALQADGKIVLTGSERDVDMPTIGGGAQQFIVVRYTRTGRLDSSFGRGGIVRHSDLADVNADSFGTQVFVQPSNTIVALGRVTNLDGFSTFVYQFSTTGRQLFPSAAAKNALYAQSPECKEALLNIRMNPSGKLSIFRSEPSSGCKEIYYRTNSDLSIDTSVNVITQSVPSISAVESDGKLISAGQSYVVVNNAVTATMAVFRYTERGRLDADFGNNGVSVAPIYIDGGGNSSDTLVPSAATLAVMQPNGMILAGGTYTVLESGDETSYIVFARFLGKPVLTPIYTRYIPIIMNGR